MNRYHGLSRYFLSMILLAVSSCGGNGVNQVAPLAATPNILFIIMDDVGADQMASFGYGGNTPAAMPTIDLLAQNGIRFRNTWSMPACTPSRAVFFEGRYPGRTQIYNAIGPSDLANSMVSPYEQTIPKLLQAHGYQSALIGKYHLADWASSPYGNTTPNIQGFDYFYGWRDAKGDPSSIDTTAGGVDPVGTDTCGFIADPLLLNGSCYYPDGTCAVIAQSNGVPVGKSCLDSGGILVPAATNTCNVAMQPVPAAFDMLNAHFVSPVLINQGIATEVPPLSDMRSRQYRTTAEVDAAINWINSRPAGTPWMTTVSFSAVHTPLQQPPASLLSSTTAQNIALNALDCSNTNNHALLSNAMIEAMDAEIGRLLVATGIATTTNNGALNYNPATSNTMIVIVGDNGTIGYTVKLPFDPSRAKGTAYQTGVWVPLIVSGPQIVQPNRDVNHMTNIADIYQLFAEIAGIDVPTAVVRPVDSVSMKPYLDNPSQSSVRTWNYTEIGLNLQTNGAINGPCQFANSCGHIAMSKTVCEDNGGVWWGAGATDPTTVGIPAAGLVNCCDVQVWKANNGQATTKIMANASFAVRNASYKLIRNVTHDYDPVGNICLMNNVTEEFYAIDELAPNPQIDYINRDLLNNPPLTAAEQSNYTSLKNQLDSIRNNMQICPGDGNLDQVVDATDVINYNKLVALGAQSSWYDLNLDGVTDAADLAIINANMGMRCTATALPQ
ncbi:MAG: sulfatase-like hydrolase/transferase [Zetaproteobacteria bacterium]|nr:sulfatase-like hydrolase/transferase [Zetaproteobacteria bacterium]